VPWPRYAVFMTLSYFYVNSNVETEGLYFAISLKYLDPTTEPVQELYPLQQEIRTIGLVSCDLDVS